MHSATAGFLCRACPRLGSAGALTPSSGGKRKQRGSPCHPEQRPSPGCRAQGRHRERLPMSELQKESWGWLGEHVHASAPQSPRLQLPRSTTSPSQGVIAAGAAARLSKVAVRAAGGAAAAGAHPPGRAGQLWPRACCPPRECPAGRDAARRGCLGAGARLCGPARSPGPGAGAGGAEARAAVREPARCPFRAAAPRPSDIARSPGALPLGLAGPAPPTNRGAALPHRTSEKGAGPGGHGATGRGHREGSGPYRE